MKDARHCFAIPKLLYFLRSGPCFKRPELLAEYDTVMKTTLEKVLNTQLDEEKHVQSSLPIKFGGLGIRRATDLALPAFISSAHGAGWGIQNLLGEFSLNSQYPVLSEAEELWKQRFDNDLMPLPANPTVQAEWDGPLYRHIYKGLLEGQTVPSEKARLLAVASEEASNWLNAPPVSSLDYKLDDDSFRLAVGLRLGTKLVEPHKCVCGQVVDPLGRHGLSCKNAKGTKPRHDKINDILFRALRVGGMPSKLEVQGLCQDDAKRPDGVTIFAWSEGKNVAWDVTCADTVCQSHIANTSREAGKAAEVAETAKLTKYDELTRDFDVIPVAMETFGSWGQLGIKFVRQIGERMATKTGDKQSKYHLLQQISMAVQRGNIASIMGTLPNQRQWDKIFHM